MKSKTITLFCFLFSSVVAYATHNVAGNITFEQIGTYSIEATIHTFTEASSVAADRDTLTICWGDGLCENIARTFEGFLGDKKHNKYTYAHTYANHDTYIISMTDPNRNGGILNVNFPGSENVQFHLETEITISNIFNNSPILLEMPLDIGFVNTPFFHNPNAFDFEGDSLAYKSIIPMQTLGEVVPNYVFPNEIPQGTNSSFSINEQNGTISWENPQQPGSYVIAMLIEEYRDGKKLSSMVRDMEIIIEPFGLVSNPPKIVVPNDEVQLEEGETISFDVTFEDLESDVKVTATGGPFEVDDPAVFDAPLGHQSSPLTVNFEWKTSFNHGRTQPYQIVFKAIDKDTDDLGAMSLKVVEILVEGDPNIIIIDSLPPSIRITAFPNPVNDFLNLSWDGRAIKDNLNVEVINEIGQVIKRDQIKNNDQWSGKIDVSDLLPGVYFIRISFAEEEVIKKILIR